MSDDEPASPRVSQLDRVKQEYTQAAREILQRSMRGVAKTKLTPDMLTLEVRREYAGQVQVHSRASILQRMFSHEAYHCGELSQTLGIHGLPQIDLWAASV